MRHARLESRGLVMDYCRECTLDLYRMLCSNFWLLCNCFVVYEILKLLNQVFFAIRVSYVSWNQHFSYIF